MHAPTQPLPLPDAAQAQVRVFVERFVRPTEAEYALLFSLATEQQYAARTVLATATQAHEKVHLVLEGIARHTYRYAGQEHTVQFSGPGEWLLAVDGCLAQKPPQTTLVAVSSLRTVGLTYAQLRHLHAASPVWARYERQVLAAGLLAFRQRALALQIKPAADRYAELLRTHPLLFNQVPLHYLASYLGIAKETLSRLRRRAAAGSPNRSSANR